MCLGIPLLGAVLSIAQAGVGFIAAQQQADAQNAAAEQNRVNAVAAANDRYASIQHQTLQEREAASQKLFQARIDGLRQRATTKVAAGEAGQIGPSVTGLSVDALLSDQRAQLARSEEAIQTNFDIKADHARGELEATYHNTVGRINSVRRAASPSLLPFLIQGAAGAVNAYKPTGAQYAGTA